MQDKNILLVSPEPWDHIFVSKHHYAVHLGRRNNKVFFLNPPGKSRLVTRTDYQNVQLIHYAGFPKGLRYYPRILQRHLIRKKFHALERLCGISFDIIWSFDNSVFFDFSALPASILKISHIVDLNQDFQTARAATTADICFCTTELIKARLLQYNARCHKINHGFNNASHHHKAVSLPGTSPVKVLYAGNLAMPYIDWKILNIVVRDNPDADFIFIGPNKQEGFTDKTAKQQVIQAKNAYFLGRVDSDDLLPFYKAADILILAYQEEHHADQANPHKMMEYLGSGRMIVATETAEFRELCDAELLLMSNTNEEFPVRFRQALNHLDYWNDGTRVKSRMDWAADNSYDKQLSRIEQFINASE